MIPELALALAGPGSVLASRPRGVVHVVTAGPLTPAGAIPRARRPVCRTRTRQLRRVAIPTGWSSLHPESRLPRLCARCSACLVRRQDSQTPRVVSPAGQAEQLPRDHYRRLYADLTAADLVVAAHCAVTPDEVDQVAHLSLLVLGHRGCTAPNNLPSGHSIGSVHAAIARRRTETPHDDIRRRAAAADEHAEKARSVRIARAEEIKAARDRERAIPRLNPTGASL